MPGRHGEIGQNGDQAAEWAAEMEELWKALEAKDGLLKEAVSKNASLAANLEQV